MVKDQIHCYSLVDAASYLKIDTKTLRVVCSFLGIKPVFDNKNKQHFFFSMSDVKRIETIQNSLSSYFASL